MKINRVSAGWLRFFAGVHARVIERELRESRRKSYEAEDVCDEIALEIECLQGDLRDAKERAAELWAQYNADRRMAEAILNELDKITRPPPPAGSVPQVIDKRVGT